MGFPGVVRRSQYRRRSKEDTAVQLIHVAIEGYRRFEQRSTIRLEGPLTAIVGPNEAGKSSVLRALELLNDDEPIPDTDVTRGHHGRTVIEATFVLNKADRDALGDLPGASKVRTCVIRKSKDGPVRAVADPSPPHDTTARNALGKRLQGLDQLRILQHGNSDQKTAFAWSELDDLAKVLRSTMVDVSRFVPRFRKIAQGMRTATQKWPQYGDAEVSRILALADEFEAVAEHEAVPAPVAVGRALADLRPMFLSFGARSRVLDTVHSLRAAHEKRSEALKNLLSLAQLDLAAVIEAVDRERPGDRRALLDEANDRLHDIFSKAWVRGQVTPLLEVQGTDELHIVVKDFDGRSMSPISERSDGLRWFIAMRAFLGVQAQGHSKPILLVDEAETHLSYDAQANLVQELATQDVAQKVIYTTHSAGCLPADLGTGIKPVVAADDKDRSSISNNFWHQNSDRPGFTSLMLAMGASALAFTPARNVVVGEGASECILLPTLLREATGNKPLPFQVAPGLSEVSASSLPYLLDSGARVAFVADADDSGRKRRKWAEENGIPGHHVVLYDDEDVDLDVVVLEDLLTADVYAQAVNAVLERYAVTDDRLAVDEVPSHDRSNYVKGWLKDRGLKPGDVQKPLVCQEAVALSYGHDGRRRKVVDARHVDGLKRLRTVLTKRLRTAIRAEGTGGA